MSKEISVEANKKWEEGEVPFLSIITPIFNRKDLMRRSMESLENQTCKDFEHILVDDGSQENVDDVVHEYMERVPFPVLYIKKANGGTHTARNMGIKHARGPMTGLLDTDDEYVPNTVEVVETLFKKLLPLGYTALGCRSQDENGIPTTPPYPEGVNDDPEGNAWEIDNKFPGEKMKFFLTGILQNNPWPEPPGITYVREGILWSRICRDEARKAYLINDTLRIFHTEAPGRYSLASQKKTSVQRIKNNAWNCGYILNHPELYHVSLKRDISEIFHYCTYDKILKYHKTDTPLKLESMRNRAIGAVLSLPSWLAALVYMKKRM